MGRILGKKNTKQQSSGVTYATANGFKNRCYPPEWEKQKTVWMSYPHNEKEWGKKRLPEIRRFYNKLISIILRFQDVHLIFPSEELFNDVEMLHGTPLRGKYKLKKIIIPNNDIWIRDHGPFFINSKSEKIVLDFEFNAWGEKFPPWNFDNEVPKEIAKYLGLKRESYPIVLEGGAIDFSGNGLALTTKQCLLNKKRNPLLRQKDHENILKTAFNLKEIIWLENGLNDDHTDGHIDNVARFIGHQKILVTTTKNKKNKNYEALSYNLDLLKKWRHPSLGYKLEIAEVLLPQGVRLGKKILPASYINFIFLNNAILVPLFNCNEDKEALKIFSKIFPTRKIIGIDSSLLIQEGGGLHCMTKQEPLI